MVSPLTFIPASPHDPIPLGRALGPGHDPPNHLLFGADSHQVHLFGQFTKLLVVTVAFDQSRDYDGPIEISHYRGGSPKRFDIPRRTHGQNQPILQRHGFGIGCPDAVDEGRIRSRHPLQIRFAPGQGVDPGVGQNEIRHVIRCGLGCATCRHVGYQACK